MCVTKYFIRFASYRNTKAIEILELTSYNLHNCSWLIQEFVNHQPELIFEKHIFFKFSHVLNLKENLRKFVVKTFAQKLALTYAVERFANFLLF